MLQKISPSLTLSQALREETVFVSGSFPSSARYIINVVNFNIVKLINAYDLLSSTFSISYTIPHL